jgi:hypothetical protein
VELPEHDRIARRAFKRFVGQRHQPGRAEAGGEALEARGGELPIGVAAGAAHQVGLPAGAFEEGGAKLREQFSVAADGSGERGIEGAGIVNHSPTLSRSSLTARILSLSRLPKDGKQSP